MKRTVLKVAKKSKRKPLKHARKKDILEDQFKNAQGSIVLGNQYVAIEKDRVRNALTGKEVKLKAYEQFQDPKLFEQQVFAKGLRKVSQRDYEKGLSTIANSFGFKKSSVSRKWIKSTGKKIDKLQNRSLKELDIRAIFSSLSMAAVF